MTDPFRSVEAPGARRQSRHGARHLVASALALALAGGAGAAAAEAPVVNVYNWADYIGSETIAAFEAA